MAPCHLIRRSRLRRSLFPSLLQATMNTACTHTRAHHYLKRPQSLHHPVAVHHRQIPIAPAPMFLLPQCSTNTMDAPHHQVLMGSRLPHRIPQMVSTTPPTSLASTTSTNKWERCPPRTTTLASCLTGNSFNCLWVLILCCNQTCLASRT